MEHSTTLNNRTVRIATSLFFFVCVPLSIWETSFVQSKIYVSNDPVATANNLLANEFIFRTSIVSHVIGTICFVLLTFLFYRLLKPVNHHLARLMVVPIIAQLAIVFALEALNYAALMTLKAQARPSFDITQQQETAYFLFRIFRYAIGADKIIFGLFLIPLGLLFLQSKLTPAIISLLIIAGGIGYCLDTGLYFLLQRPDYLAVQSLKLFSSALYSLSFLWLLIKGVHEKNTTH